MRMRTSLWFLASSFAVTAAACSSGSGEATETVKADLDTVAAPTAAADADGVGSQPASVIIEDPMANHSKILLFMLLLLTTYWFDCGG